MSATAEYGKPEAHQPRRPIDPDLLPNIPRLPQARTSRADRSRPDQRGCWRIHIKRVLNCQYGYPLPNDDAGSECFSLYVTPRSLVPHLR